MSQLLTIVSLVVLLAARASDAQVGSAPVNWCDDSATVALWTFNGNANNVSASRTYCAAGEADLTRYAGQSGGLSFDRAIVRREARRYALDGATTLRRSRRSTTRCLRTGSPEPVDDDVLDAEHVAQHGHVRPVPDDHLQSRRGRKRRHWPERLLRDVHQRRRAPRADVRVHAREEPVERRLPFIASALTPSSAWHFGAVSTPAARCATRSRARRCRAG